MTDDRMVLIDLIEKSADTDLVREMLSFAAERLMEAKVEARTGAAHGARDPAWQVQRTAIASGFGTRAAAGLSLRSPSCAKTVTFPLSWSRGARRRRRSRPSFRRLTCTASRPARWMTWSRRWGLGGLEESSRSDPPEASTPKACPSAAWLTRSMNGSTHS